MQMTFITTLRMGCVVSALALVPTAHSQSRPDTPAASAPASTTATPHRSVCQVFSSQNPRLFVSTHLASRGSLDGCTGTGLRSTRTGGKADSMEAHVDANTPDVHGRLSAHYQESKRRFGEGFPNMQVTDLSGANCPGAEMFSLTYPHTDLSYGMAYLPCHTHLVRAEATGNADFVQQLANMARQVAAMPPPRPRTSSTNR